MSQLAVCGHRCLMLMAVFMALKSVQPIRSEAQIHTSNNENLRRPDRDHILARAALCCVWSVHFQPESSILLWHSLHLKQLHNYCCDHLPGHDNPSLWWGYNLAQQLERSHFNYKLLGSSNTVSFPSTVFNRSQLSAVTSNVF